ncbi:unnamed protein product [Protopolystoma xenopodis]|uniref:Uncharacterized protein n=1 Tax=Protopolystoma xenopodis TaxID=117903 RepID=A0A448X622_9PLAT|nr:unnamed protein product [Protopolystoma xenopodis]
MTSPNETDSVVTPLKPDGRGNQSPCQFVMQTDCGASPEAETSPRPTATATATATSTETETVAVAVAETETATSETSFEVEEEAESTRADEPTAGSGEGAGEAEKARGVRGCGEAGLGARPVEAGPSLLGCGPEARSLVGRRGAALASRLDASAGLATSTHSGAKGFEPRGPIRPDLVATETSPKVGVGNGLSGLAGQGQGLGVGVGLGLGMGMGQSLAGRRHAASATNPNAGKAFTLTLLSSCCARPFLPPCTTTHVCPSVCPSVIRSIRPHCASPKHDSRFSPAFIHHS